MAKIQIRPLEEREAEMIQVNDKYLIDTDQYNYIVRFKGVDKQIAFFGSIEGALKYIYDDMCKSAMQREARNLLEAIRVIEKIKDDFVNVVRIAFPEYEVVKRK